MREPRGQAAYKKIQNQCGKENKSRHIPGRGMGGGESQKRDREDSLITTR